MRQRGSSAGQLTGSAARRDNTICSNETTRARRLPSVQGHVRGNFTVDDCACSRDYSRACTENCATDSRAGLHMTMRLSTGHTSRSAEHRKRYGHGARHIPLPILHKGPADVDRLEGKCAIFKSENRHLFGVPLFHACWQVRVLSYNGNFAILPSSKPPLSYHVCLSRCGQIGSSAKAAKHEQQVAVACAAPRRALSWECGDG